MNEEYLDEKGRFLQKNIISDPGFRIQSERKVALPYGMHVFVMEVQSTGV